VIENNIYRVGYPDVQDVAPTAVSDGVYLDIASFFGHTDSQARVIGEAGAAQGLQPLGPLIFFFRNALATEDDFIAGIAFYPRTVEVEVQFAGRFGYLVFLLCPRREAKGQEECHDDCLLFHCIRFYVLCMLKVSLDITTRRKLRLSPLRKYTGYVRPQTTPLQCQRGRSVQRSVQYPAAPTGHPAR